MAILSFPWRWRSPSPGGWKGLAADGSPQGGAGFPGRTSGFLSSLGIMAGSRRVRFVLVSVLASLALVSVAHHYDALPDAASAVWRKPDGTTDHDAAGVDWSSFAYVQYVTNSNYLCNSVMIMETLHRLGSRPDRVMLYPSKMLEPDATSSTSHDGQLLLKARDEYGAKLIPISVQSRDSEDGNRPPSFSHRPSPLFPLLANTMLPETWSDSFTKLLAFNQTQYARVLSLDSDALLLQTMDELFLLPPFPLAMPCAYWLTPTANSSTIVATDAQRETKFTSTIMLVTPSVSEFDRVMAAVATASHNAYDMEVVNALYGDTARVLPHRPYMLLSQVLRWESDAERALYLGEGVAWDAERLVAEAKYVHFSDWPIPKPWLPTPPGLKVDKEPRCTGPKTCVERELWNGWYDEYRGRREVCPVAVSLCCD